MPSRPLIRALSLFSPIFSLLLHLRVKEIYISFLDLLEKNNIRPLVVFDGLPLPAKEGVRVKRARWEKISHVILTVVWFNLPVTPNLQAKCSFSIHCGRKYFKYSCRQREQQKEKAEPLRRSGNETEAKKALAATTEISHETILNPALMATAPLTPRPEPTTAEAFLNSCGAYPIILKYFSLIPTPNNIYRGVLCRDV